MRNLQSVNTLWKPLLMKVDKQPPQKKKGAIEMDGRVRFYYLSSLLPSLAAHHTPNITHTKRIDLNTYIYTYKHARTNAHRHTPSLSFSIYSF